MVWFPYRQNHPALADDNASVISHGFAHALPSSAFCLAIFSNASAIFARALKMTPSLCAERLDCGCFSTAFRPREDCS